MLPALFPLPECPEIPAHSVIIVGKVKIIIGHGVMASLITKEGKAQLQPVHLRTAHGTVDSMLDLPLVPDGLSRIKRSYPWP